MQNRNSNVDGSTSDSLVQNGLLSAVPGKPRSGVWGDPDVYNAYCDLVKELSELIPDYAVGLHIKGNGPMCKAKGKMIVAKAKILQDMINAVCR